jgi:hypothetical protein
VIGRVVGDQQDLPQVRLAVAMRDLRREVDVGVRGQALECRAVLSIEAEAISS